MNRFGKGKDVFIRHYEVRELADAAENNINKKQEVKTNKSNSNKKLHSFHKMLLKIRDLEAIVVAGINGNTAYALPHDLLIKTLKEYNRLKE